MSLNAAAVEFVSQPLAAQPAAYDEASLALWMIGAALVLFQLSLVIALCTISGQSGRWRGEDISESPPGITPAGALERPTDERPDAA